MGGFLGISQGRLTASTYKFVAHPTTLVIDRLRARDEWKFAGVLRQADRSLTVAWWTLLVLRGVLPARLLQAAPVTV